MKKKFRKIIVLYYNLLLKIRKTLNKEKGVIIHLYSLCWNEEKLLPFFLDYYNEFVRKITIYDNYSSDSSEQIMKQYKIVEVLKYDSNDTINDLLYLDIKNNSWKKSRGKADFVIVCDIDEFLYSDNLKDTVRFLKESKYTITKPNGYQMVSKVFPKYSKDKKITDIVKTGISAKEWLSKSILFDPNNIIEINYLPGAHECTPVGEVKMYNSEDLKLLHYKDLSLKYLLQRKKEFRNRLSQVNLNMDLGTYYFDDEKRTTELFKERTKNSTIVI